MEGLQNMKCMNLSINWEFERDLDHWKVQVRGEIVLRSGVRLHMHWKPEEKLDHLYHL